MGWRVRIGGTKWVQRVRRTGERGPVGTGGHRPSVLAPEGDWLLKELAAEPGITLAALSERLFRQRKVRADLSMLSRFLRREGLLAAQQCCAVQGSALRRRS